MLVICEQHPQFYISSLFTLKYYSLRSCNTTLFVYSESEHQNDIQRPGTAEIFENIICSSLLLLHSR